jgi:hypothetical protein
MNSKNIYTTLCSNRKSLKESWGYGSGLHRHHIQPKHSGGKDIESNYTYLTPREHVIAHYLLWRIYKNANDLRSMRMLGAKLSFEKRQKVGLFCKENNIGIFAAKESDRKEWRLRGIKTQKENYKNIGDKNSFYYWSTKEGQNERASMGGKKGSKSQIKNKIGIHTGDQKLRSEWATLGAKAHKGKRCMYKPGDKSFIRVKPEDINAHLEQGYIFGSPLSRKNNFNVSSSS